LYSGSIFDLEDSPEIEAHLKPLDLYRALKPMGIPSQQTQLEDRDQSSMTLRILGYKRLTPYLARRLRASTQGDVLQEIYYSVDEEPLVTIHRRQFEKHRLSDIAVKETIFYPRQVFIESHATPKSVMLQFEDIQFLTLLENQDWSLTVPHETARVYLGGEMEEAG